MASSGKNCLRSEPNFGDLLLDRRPSHFVPPEMRERRLFDLLSASGSGPVSFARRVRTPTIWPAVHRTRWSKCQAVASSSFKDAGLREQSVITSPMSHSEAR